VKKWCAGLPESPLVFEAYFVFGEFGLQNSFQINLLPPRHVESQLRNSRLLFHQLVETITVCFFFFLFQKPFPFLAPSPFVHAHA
jgi:hypothetical protein